MSSTLNYSVFAQRVSEVFVTSLGANRVELELTECNPLKAHVVPGGAPREAFSLVFRGPRGMALPQTTYALHNEALGTVEIFLVPIGPDGNGQGYEAIFN